MSAITVAGQNIWKKRRETGLQLVLFRQIRSTCRCRATMRPRSSIGANKNRSHWHINPVLSDGFYTGEEHSIGRYQNMIQGSKEIHKSVGRSEMKPIDWINQSINRTNQPTNQRSQTKSYPTSKSYQIFNLPIPSHVREQSEDYDEVGRNWQQNSSAIEIVTETDWKCEKAAKI